MDYCVHTEQTSAGAAGAGILGEGWTTAVRAELLTFLVFVRCFSPKNSVVDRPARMTRINVWKSLAGIMASLGRSGVQ